MDKEILGIGVIEWIGYLGSLILLLSYLMKSVNKLRIVGTFGCVVFLVYGWLDQSWPVVITNGAIILINLYYLFYPKKTNKNQ